MFTIYGTTTSQHELKLKIEDIYQDSSTLTVNEVSNLICCRMFFLINYQIFTMDVVLRMYKFLRIVEYISRLYYKTY